MGSRESGRPDEINDHHQRQLSSVPAHDDYPQLHVIQQEYNVGGSSSRSSSRSSSSKPSSNTCSRSLAKEHSIIVAVLHTACLHFAVLPIAKRISKKFQPKLPSLMSTCPLVKRRSLPHSGRAVTSPLLGSSQVGEP